MKGKILLAIGLSCLSFMACAQQISKEETAVPEQEGALTLDQIPSLSSTKKEVKQKVEGQQESSEQAQ